MRAVSDRSRRGTRLECVAADNRACRPIPFFWRQSVSCWRRRCVEPPDHHRYPDNLLIINVIAHQNVPFGGYGMNTGVGDAYDIATKLSLVLREAGGENLLQSYELERRPVASRNASHAAKHMAVHLHYVEKCLRLGDDAMTSSDSTEAKELHDYIKAYMTEHDGENKDIGIELDYRIRDSPVIVRGEGEEEVQWKRQCYTPSTLPGSRVPHVFLADGQTSIYDLLGDDMTVVDFSPIGATSTVMKEVADADGLPLKRVHLPDEVHVRKIWGRDVVLVRWDHFAAWRCDGNGGEVEKETMHEVLTRVFGKGGSLGSSTAKPTT